MVAYLYGNLVPHESNSHLTSFYFMLFINLETCLEPANMKMVFSRYKECKKSRYCGCGAGGVHLTGRCFVPLRWRTPSSFKVYFEHIFVEFCCVPFVFIITAFY